MKLRICLEICLSSRFMSIVLWLGITHLVPVLSQNACYVRGAWCNTQFWVILYLITKQKYNSLLKTSKEISFCSLLISKSEAFTIYIFLILFLNFTILYWFCKISKWICHGYTCIPHPEPSSLLPPRTIPLGHPSAPAPSIQYHTLNLVWQLVPYMILFQCHYPKSSHPLPLPQSPKDCSIHQCLFCCLVHRVIATIFLNSTSMC